MHNIFLHMLAYTVHLLPHSFSPYKRGHECAGCVDFSSLVVLLYSIIFYRNLVDKIKSHIHKHHAPYMKSSNIEIRRYDLEKELEFECLKCDSSIAYRKRFGEISRKKEKRILGVVKILLPLDKDIYILRSCFLVMHIFYNRNCIN